MKSQNLNTELQKAQEKLNKIKDILGWRFLEDEDGSPMPFEESCSIQLEKIELLFDADPDAEANSAGEKTTNINISTELTEVIDRSDVSKEQWIKEHNLMNIYIGAITHMLGEENLDPDEFLHEMEEIITNLSESLYMMEEDSSYEPTIHRTVQFHQLQMRARYLEEVIEEAGLSKKVSNSSDDYTLEPK